jgi:hypothetical protein
VGAANKKKGELPLTYMLGYGRVTDCICVKYSNQFVVDGPNRKPFAREKQAD